MSGAHHLPEPAVRAVEPTPEPLTLALTGDVMLGRLVNDVIRRRGFAYPWGDMLSTLRDADLLCINLECALTSHTEQWRGDPHKPFFFRADPGVVETLRLAKVDFAALANNHIMDFGVAGLLETVGVLDQAGIAHAGAGPDIAAASAPALLSARGWRVAIVAFADYPEAWCAVAGEPGMCFTPVSPRSADFAAVEHALANARDAADVVIFSMHWGPNMRLRPPPHFQDFAHGVLEAGADVFWGHSAHLLQGLERVDGKVILYDTGDFVDDYAVNSLLRNDFSALFLLRMVPGAVERIEVVPALIDSMRVTRATGSTRQEIVERLSELSAEFGTTLRDQPEGLLID
jgi:poly-gamma-glutamate capsule biosynthesis protein CapA/YwtB (metallophosphatase superfamily)